MKFIVIKGNLTGTTIEAPNIGAAAEILRALRESQRVLSEVEDLAVYKEGGKLE